MLGPTPRHADLIGLESSLGIRSVKISPEGLNVQQSLRTTNNLLEAYRCNKTETPVLLTPEPALPIRNYLLPYLLKYSEDTFISGLKGWFLRNKQTLHHVAFNHHPTSRQDGAKQPGTICLAPRNHYRNKNRAALKSTNWIWGAFTWRTRAPGEIGTFKAQMAPAGP